MNKPEARKKALDTRKTKTLEQIAKLSDQVVKKILVDVHFQKADRIGMYYPIKNELNLLRLMESAHKSFCFPFIEGQEMVYKEVKKLEDLNYAVKIPEPFEQALTIQKNEIDYMLIPGIAFNEKHHRLGYGKGYFDRFLEDYRGIKVGIGFAELIWDTIEFNDFDIPMDYVIKGE